MLFTRPLFYACALMVAGAPAFAARLTLEWDDNSSNEDGFRIERALGSGPFVHVASVPRDTERFVDSALLPATFYRYRVSSYNIAGRSTFSNLASAVTAALTTGGNGGPTAPPQTDGGDNGAPPPTGPIGDNGAPPPTGPIGDNGAPPPTGPIPPPAPVNTPPTISAIEDVAMGGEGTTISFRINDSQTPASHLRLHVMAQNPLLLPSLGLRFGGTGSDRTLTLRAPSGLHGSTRVTISVNDGTLVAARSFTVDVGGASLGSFTDEWGGSEMKLAGGDETRLVNLSARALTGKGVGTLMLGFTAAEGELPVVLRAIGPGLRQFGLSDIVEDARLQVYQGAALVAESADRVPAGFDDVFGRIGAFPLASGSEDAALRLSLSPGAYSAHLPGDREDLRVVLAELFSDGEGSAAGRLVNMSARGWVGTGSQQMHLGFALRGDRPVTLLIRAVAHGLEDHGVGNVLPRPRLSLFAGDQLLSQTESWQGTPEAAAAAERVGAVALTHPDDSAMLVRLEPGSYTVTIGDAEGRSGIVLAELYQLPE